MAPERDGAVGHVQRRPHPRALTGAEFLALDYVTAVIAPDCSQICFSLPSSVANPRQIPETSLFSLWSMGRPQGLNSFVATAKHLMQHFIVKHSAIF